MKKLPGFSLVEILIYFATLSIVVTITVVAISDMTRSHRLDTEYQLLLENDHFLNTRFDNLFLGMKPSNVTQPAAGVTGSTLVVTNTQGTFTFSEVGGRLMLQRGSATALPITDNHITVSNTQFQRTTISGVDTVIVTFRLTNRTDKFRDFKKTLYLL